MIIVSIPMLATLFATVKGTNGQEVKDEANKFTSTTCPPHPTLKSYAMLQNGTPVMIPVGPFPVCSCQSDGTNWTAPDGQPCLTLALGYNEEWTRKYGTCHNGTCLLTVIPRGCSNPRTQKKQGNQPSVGCAYTCLTANFTREFNYHPPGTNCTHLGPHGQSRINTTCKESGNKVICRETVPLPPAC
uniref:Basic tail secreted protein n=1 Tax=Rhipicephalus zambeziensis TaxID=60191 RepID=A0A224YCM4_9ACAR